jgi:hypothetical protein
MKVWSLAITGITATGSPSMLAEPPSKPCVIVAGCPGCPALGFGMVRWPGWLMTIRPLRWGHSGGSGNRAFRASTAARA